MRPSKALPMRVLRLLAVLVVALTLPACREVRVQTFGTGTTTLLGPPQIVVLRDERFLAEYGIKRPVRFNHEFAVLLLMGPHATTGWSQLIESIRANGDRERIVAFEHQPLDGGEPTREYRTYTLWIVPNAVYRVGAVVDAVTPSGDLV